MLLFANFLLLLKNGLISNEELGQAAKTIQLQITILSILEAIIVTMTNGEQFAQDVYQHLSKRSGSPYPGNPVVDFYGLPLMLLCLNALSSPLSNQACSISCFIDQ